MTHTHKALQLFEQLLIAAPSGREERLADLVRAHLDDLEYAHLTDGAGNISVILGGQDPTLGTCLLAAHMDEIGMVVTGIETDGSLRVTRSGGLMPWKHGEGPVEIIGDGVETIVGIFSMGSTHKVGAEDEAIKWEDCWIITGLTPEQLAEKGIRIGSTAVPTRERRGPVLFGDEADPLVGAWTFDDRIGVVTLLRLLERMKKEEIKPLHNTVIAFTVHEEGGGNGAKSLAHRMLPEIFISVDGSPIPPNSPLKLDGRPGIWSKDRLGHYDQKLVREFMTYAQEAGTELQPVVFDRAASDASLVYYAGLTQRPVCIGHVRENSHGYEVLRLSVLDNLLETLVVFIKDWRG